MYEISAGAVVYYKEIQSGLPIYLILKYNTGHWDFPKGKLESGENLVQAAQREVAEETGLQVQIDESFKEELGYFYTKKNGMLVSKTVVFFVAESKNVFIVLSHEHQHFQWLPYDDALKVLTYQNARDVLARAHEHIINFCLK